MIPPTQFGFEKFLSSRGAEKSYKPDGKPISWLGECESDGGTVTKALDMLLLWFGVLHSSGRAFYILCRGMGPELGCWSALKSTSRVLPL
jgi:hypothetical protein